MKAHKFTSQRSLQRYMTGDLLLELDRLEDSGPVMLSTRGATGGGMGDPAQRVLDIIKPKAEDYPALTATLQVLKFSAEDVVEYHKAIGSLVNLAAGCASIVGAAFAVADFVGKLMSDGEVDENTQRLRHLTDRVEAIYTFLKDEQRNGLYDEAVRWRGDLDKVYREVANARISRAPLTLQSLYDLKDVLDENLNAMLDPGSPSGEGGPNIAFVRDAYGYHYATHWVDACQHPYMARVDGTPLNYRDKAQDLKARIWDPGHYIDVLLNTLQARLLLLATTEPAFRSTYFDMVQLNNIANKLTIFLAKWRASMIVADPLAGLNGGGPLQNPVSNSGIVLGAVDPVTGVAFFDPMWANGPIRYKNYHPLGIPGIFTRTEEARFVDPQGALRGALDLQPRLLAGAIAASGIQRFTQLHRELRAILDRPQVGSDFVDLPNARFRSLELNGPAADIEPVTLDFIGRFSRNPDKIYEGRRYTQRLEKRFRFDLAMRTDVTRTQLGYRLVIAGHSISLVNFSTADASDTARFPTAPISKTIRINIPVYDVLQSQVFSAADEDTYEGGSPAPSFEDKFDQFVTISELDPRGFHRIAKHASTPNGIFITSTFDVGRVVEVAGYLSPQRLFTNERQGNLSLQVDVTFDPTPGNRVNPFAGQAHVAIRNTETETARHGAILPVEVYETRVADESGATEEVLADRMTIHFVPSFLVVDRSYFIDREEGMDAIDRIFGGINEKYAISTQEVIPVGPEWSVRRRLMEETVRIAAVKDFERKEPAFALQVFKRFVGGAGQL